MIKTNHNRLYYAGVSFRLPNNMYIDTNTEIVHENGLCFEAENGEFNISIVFNYCDDTSENILKTIFEDYSAIIYKPISNIEWNGLNGSCAVYALARAEYYEIQFNPVDGYDENCSIVVRAETSKAKIGEIMVREEVTEFLKDIRKE